MTSASAQWSMKHEPVAQVHWHQLILILFFFELDPCPHIKCLVCVHKSAVMTDRQTNRWMDIWRDSKTMHCTVVHHAVKNCSLYTTLTATDWKKSKIIKKVILPTITLNSGNVVVVNIAILRFLLFFKHLYMYNIYRYIYPSAPDSVDTIPHNVDPSVYYGDMVDCGDMFSRGIWRIYPPMFGGPQYVSLVPTIVHTCVGYV